MKNGMPELAEEIEKTMDDIDNDGSLMAVHSSLGARFRALARSRLR